MHPNTPLPAKLLLIGAMAYVVIPFDIVPDVLPLLGQADDILALIIAGMTFLRMTHAVREKLRTPQK
jgi:carbonic anhydrase